MKTLKVLLALALALACPGAATADYTICNGNSCRTVRTPVRNAASRVVQWAAPARYSTGSSTVVRTYRRGLFGRRVYTGYATVSSPQASYGSSGTTTTTYYTSEPTSGYGSTGATTSYATPPTLQNTTKIDQVETVSTSAVDCDCNGECNCPCCPCKPAAKKPDDLNLRLSTKRLQIPTFQLAKKLHVPDLRLAAR